MKKLSLLLFVQIWVCLAWVGCKKSVDTLAPSSTVVTVTTTTTSIKSPIVGLVAQGSANSQDSTWIPDNSFPEINAHSGVYVATVIRVQWKQLEPLQGQFNFSVIDSALSNIKKYNTANPTAPVTGKLRVFCGVNVPNWVKVLAGGPVAAVDPTSGVNIRIACFWTPDYRAAWQSLQTALAAKYDSNTLLQEVAVSSCSTITAEPFVQPFNSTTIPMLHAAGFTDAAFKAALSGALDDYAPWKLTAVDYTFNEFRATDSGQPKTDTIFAPALMQSFRARYGARGVVANHGLQSPPDGSANTIYTSFLTLGRPLEFQTLSPGVDWNSTIALGLTFNPTEIEIWDTKAAGGSANISLSQLQMWASQIRK